MDWQPIESAPRTDDDDQPQVLVLQDGRRFVAEWDPSAGQWQGVEALDGVERERYYQEWPGRLYSPTHWAPFTPDDTAP